MRRFLVLACCVGLASLVGAAQQSNENNNDQRQKKKGAQQQQQQQHVVTQQTGKFKGGQHNQNFQQPHTVSSNVSPHPSPHTHMKSAAKGQSGVTPASSTTFNKSKTVNKNITVNKNYQFKQYNLSKNANPKYQAMTFNQNFHIAGAQNWKGANYAVFVNYHPIWQNQVWWNAHYHNHIVFILGGWYFWNAGYWFPAWGYDPSAVYYYDGPIYASNPQMDPGQVVANVQSALQEQGYYQGDIDGILGPQTRAALAEYQSAQGLEPTGAVDEPTLELLGMA